MCSKISDTSSQSFRLYSASLVLSLLEQATDLLAPAAAVQQLALSQQLPGDIIQGETLEAVEGGPQQLDAVEDHPARALGGAAFAFIVKLAPVHRPAVAPQHQAPPQLVRHPLQVPGIEVHHVPADQYVGVVVRQPVEKGLQDRLLVGTGLHEVLLRTLTHHEYPALMTLANPAVHTDGIELHTLHGGLDIKGHHLEGGPVVAGFHRRVFQQYMPAELAGVALQHRAAVDEPLHQEAVRRVDIRLQRVEAEGFQGIRQAPGLAVAGAVDPDRGGQAKAAQLHRLQLQARLRIQQGPGLFQLALLQEENTALTTHQGAQGPAVGGEPVLQLYAVTGIAPVAGEEKTFEGLCSQTCFPG